ncbi:MAG: hypothetical protein EOO71_28800 [Myxococcaceae bacterium]|nr:MAG: hypothetical protein EOO71_28800 [Myxococcaceae bacterium]
MPRSLSRIALLACALTLGCDSGAPYYRLDWGGADTVTVTPGDSVPYDIAIQRIADNLEELRVSVTGAPEGVSLGPDFVLPAGETVVNTTLTLAVAPTVTTYGIGGIQLLAEDPANDVSATGGIALAILPPPVAQPDFSVAVTPRQVDLIPGARAETVITVARTAGFAGPLVITLESPTQRLTADALTLAEGQTSAQISVSADRSLSQVPVIARFVATAPDGRTASTGFTFNLRSF